MFSCSASEIQSIQVYVEIWSWQLRVLEIPLEADFFPENRGGILNHD